MKSILGTTTVAVINSVACLLVAGPTTATTPVTAPTSTVATEFFKCKMADSAKFEQMVAAMEVAKRTANDNGFGDYKLSIMIPLYDNDTSFGVFYWIGTSPTAGRLGLYNDFWKSDANKANRELFIPLIKECDHSGVYWSRDITGGK
jgi:hypothetical protein